MGVKNPLPEGSIDPFIMQLKFRKPNLLSVKMLLRTLLL